MGLRINTNTAALQAQRNLGKTTRALNKALERLASGERIVRAGDDAAGLAISEGLRSQVRGLRQAVRNANDANGFLATAEGALAEMTNIAQRLRELAIQAANGSLGPRDRGFLDNERGELVEEFSRIANSTSFNTTKLLDGTFSTVELQVGVQKGETISFTIGDARATALGALATRSGSQHQIEDGFSNLTINGESIVVSEADDGVSTSGYRSFSAIAIARAVNRVSGQTGVYADLQENVISYENMDFSEFAGVFNTGDFNINGVDIVGTAASVNEFIERVNEFSSSTGVKARLKSGSDDGLDVELYASDGRTVLVGLGAALSTGASTYFYNVIDVTENVDLFTFDASTVLDTLSAGLDSGSNGLYTGAVQLRSSESILISGTSSSAAFGFSDTVIAVDPDSALANISLADQSLAQDALAVVDATLQQITELRSNLGAIQNRLEAVINSLSITNENLTSAQAEIRDADMAVEVADLTKNQILQQAGVSVLAQANTSAQIALSLLQR
ncbi:MAG: hypothetical protein COV44_05350 [Deltaproteobacteria bacterium CG11_big_fil_rev_8_21_14_0_20_45_16]|nr:MAG: hypothetical protein COV44_05350 [Deltaproteobacteria bacterium CG11_big_fil_rev_8_21_14_0_20_45_16]